MMNFKNSKTAKVVSGFVGFATALMMVAPGIASAATSEELQAQINVLQAQIAAQSSSSQTTTTTNTSGSGYQFTADLTIGSKGQSVTELQMILVAKGFLTMPAGVAMGYFGNLTKSAVSAWQASAGISPTAGYVGPKSRAALNGMSGSSSSSTTTTTTTSGMVPGCSTTSGFSVTSGQSCATGAVVSTVAGCTSTVGFSPTTGAACSAATTSVVPAGSGVTVALDATSPMSSVLIAGQSVGTLGVFRLMNGGATEVKVTNIKLKRTGISSDSTLSNVYLYNGSSRITDAASVSVGVISFNDASGIVTIPAGGSVSVAVRSDILLGTNGQTVGVMLTGVTAGGVEATGVPVSSAEHTVATTPTDMATLNFTNTTVTPAAASIDPANDYTVWQKTVVVGSKDVLLKTMRFRQIGSVQSGDLRNFRLSVDGVLVGSAVASLDSMNYVNFSFATPVTMKTGSRTVKLMADVVGGSNRNFQFSLRQASDMEALDSQFGVTVLPCVTCTATAVTTAFSTMDAGLQTINAGTVSITKATDSLSGNVVLAGTGVTLAKFTAMAQGEKLKVESLRLNFATNDSTVGEIRNGALFANGVQIGSTADITGAQLAPSYTQYNLGSSLVLEPGVAVTLEVRGDIVDGDGTDNMTADDTLIVSIASSTSNNIQRMVSGSYFANTATAGNSLTVAAGTLSLAKYSAYANQTITIPQTAYKISEFRLTTGSTETVNLNTLTLTLANTGAIATSTDVTNLYVVYGTKTSSIKSSGAATQSWSINESLAANASIDVKVYATLGSAIPSGVTLTPSFLVSGTSQNAGGAVTSATVAGQVLTVSTGALTGVVDASTPVVALIVGNSMPKVGSFKFTAANDMFTITELAASTTDSSSIIELVFKDGATEIARQAFNGITATRTGLSIAIAANTSKVVDVYANLGAVGTNAGQTGGNVGVSLVSMKYNNSNGVETATTSPSGSGVANTQLVGNAQYVYKTKPTITNVALPTTVLTAGTMSVAKFTITADAGGTLAWRKISLSVATSTNTFTVTGWTIYDAANEATALANVTATSTVSGSTGRVDFISTADQEVSGSKTYVVKATIGGAPSTASTVTHSIATGASTFTAPVVYTSVAAPATFIWSDEAITPHSGTQASWNNDYLVKNIPTDSQALTK